MTSGFALNDTQAMLRDSLARFLTEQYDVEIRARTLAAADHQPPLWRAFAHQLGLLGAALPESVGGLGGGLVDHLVIMEVLGGHLAAEPYLSTGVVGGGLLSRTPGATAQRLLSRIVDGDAVIALAAAEPHSRHELDNLRTTVTRDGDGWRLDGRKAVVHCAPWASDLLAVARDEAGGLALIVVPVETLGVRRRDYRTLDGGRASEVVFDHVKLPAESHLGEAGALLEQVLDEATLAVCAEAGGVLSRLVADTVAYVKQRRQFGVPIASFQVLQHRLADMSVALEQATAITASAATAFRGSAATRARAVSSAKVTVARACRTVGQGAVQLHGGMGMTEELAVGHYFRRATQIELQFGSIDHHLRRIDRLSALAA